jgi:hypothetical protein
MDLTAFKVGFLDNNSMGGQAPKVARHFSSHPVAHVLMIVPDFAFDNPHKSDELCHHTCD